MIIEDQVCSLELAKKLKELGTKQDSIFVWEFFDEECHGVKYRPYAVVPYSMSLDIELFSAFTASELINLLPHRFNTIENEPFNSFRLRIEKSFICSSDGKNIKDFYIVNYRCDSTESGGSEAWLERYLFCNNISDTSLCNALAKTFLLLNQISLLPINGRHRELKIENGKVTGII